MTLGDTQVLVCPSCGNRPPHKLVFQHEHVDTWYTHDGRVSEGDAPATIHTVFECATCHDISLYQNLEPLDFDEATLLYPKEDSLHKSVPAQVASNFSEAREPISPNAFAVLVRRALEAVCDDRGVQPRTLAKRLAVLATKGEIPRSLRKLARFYGISAILGPTTQRRKSPCQ